MPQKERTDERRASVHVGRALGPELVFTDLTGDVDYTSPDGQMVLEVTRYTNADLKRDMAVAATADHALPLGTAYDWLVTFDGYPRFKGLVPRLYGPLHELETHDLELYADTMDWWLANVPTLKDTVELLNAEHVVEARRTPPSGTPSLLLVSSSGGWTYGGPDAALELLEERVLADQRHLEKLARQSADQQHLWAWVDDQTDRGLTRALSSEEDRLPSRPPDLPDSITGLWAVDEGTGRGWHWDGTTWHRVATD